MATLQVKNVPDELYAALRERAREERTSLSEVVLRMLRIELERPSLSAWVSRQRRERGSGVARDVDIEALMDDVRGEFGR